MRPGRAPILRWLTLTGLLLVCAALGYGAYVLAGYSWDQVAGYRSPYLDLPDPKAVTMTATEPLAARVVLVVVDGLREDAARQMSTLNNVQAYGSDFSLVVSEPSLSYPNWTTILSGARPHVSGVTTNWHEGRVAVPTVLDLAIAAGKTTAVVGPKDLSALYGVERADAAQLRDWPKGGYVGGMMVDDALVLLEQMDPALLLLHIPDVDEAGHRSGGVSAEYMEVVRRVDADLSRLVVGAQDDRTAFVFVSDHGHIDSGGHGGWEEDVVRVRLVMGGAGVALDSGEGRLEDVAPTVSALMGVAPPAYSEGEVLVSALATLPPEAVKGAAAQRARFARMYVEELGGTAEDMNPGEEAAAMAAAESAFLRRGRDGRLLAGSAVALACLAVFGLIGAASRPALLAATVGAVAYTAIYNVLFFVIHGYHWSLSAFNTEDMIGSFMNGRLAEAAAATLAGALFAGVVYPYFRVDPKSARGEHLPGWLSLGPATALCVLALLGLQVAWYIWAWGSEVTALLPDLKWGFKYNLDLVQATAVGFAALLTPLVTTAVGLYHPRVRRASAPKVQGDLPGE